MDGKERTNRVNNQTICIGLDKIRLVYFRALKIDLAKHGPNTITNTATLQWFLRNYYSYYYFLTLVLLLLYYQPHS